MAHLINLFSKAASFFMLLSHGRAAGLAPRVLLLFKTFCWYYCGFAPKRPGLGLVQQAQPKHGSSRLPRAEHSCHNIVSYCCDVKNVFFWISPPKCTHCIGTIIWKCRVFIVSCRSCMVLKSVHFKKTVARISFLSKLWYFQYKSKQKYHNFERNEIGTTDFLKLTDFT